MADVFKDIIYIPIELNSRNPEGNLSSDVINRSFITNIAKLLMMINLLLKSKTLWLKLMLNKVC